MSDFDAVAPSYREQVGAAVSISGFGYEYFVSRKVEHLRAFVGRHFPHPEGLRSLDIGAGEGYYTAAVGAMGIHTVIADRSLEFLKVARTQQGAVPSLVSDACGLAVGDARLDLVILAMTLHHISRKTQAQALDEAARVLRPGGLLAVYEHNPWNPLTRLVMSRLPFDRDAAPLSRPHLAQMVKQAGLDIVLQEYLFFFPAFAKWLLPLEKHLGWCPFGAQYALLAAKRE